MEAIWARHFNCVFSKRRTVLSWIQSECHLFISASLLSSDWKTRSWSINESFQAGNRFKYELNFRRKYKKYPFEPTVKQSQISLRFLQLLLLKALSSSNSKADPSTAWSNIIKYLKYKNVVVWIELIEMFRRWIFSSSIKRTEKKMLWQECQNMESFYVSQHQLREEFVVVSIEDSLKEVLMFPSKLRNSIRLFMLGLCGMFFWLSSSPLSQINCLDFTIEH